MKEIIYLDTGVIHSYIAQQFDGLPTEIGFYLAFFLRELKSGFVNGK